jgi:hypothetical protein
MGIKVTIYAATLTWVSVSDRNGVMEIVVLGFDSLNRYLAGLRRGCAELSVGNICRFHHRS